MSTIGNEDLRIGKKEMAINISSAIIGVGILTFPRILAKETGSIDGWISVMIAGGCACLISWILAKLAARFPKHSFFDYTALIATKPVAYLITFLFALYAMFFVAYEVRAVGNIAKQYLFTATPVEVIALTFLLIVQYALIGKRIALLRLNLMFLPIVLIVILMVQMYTIPYIEMENIKPFFSSSWTGILQGSIDVGLSLTGFEIILFYAVLMKHPEEAPKSAIIGLAIPIVLYLTIYVVSIGVFSAETTKNLIYPTIELAKEVEVPGGFLERIESVFFTIWIMTIFNTCAAYFDIALLCFGSIFRKVKKITWIVTLSPIIYLLSMAPETLVEFFYLGDLLTYYGMIVAYFFPALLLLIAILRGVNGHV